MDTDDHTRNFGLIRRDLLFLVTVHIIPIVYKEMILVWKTMYRHFTAVLN